MQERFFIAADVRKVLAAAISCGLIIVAGAFFVGCDAQTNGVATTEQKSQTAFNVADGNEVVTYTVTGMT